MFRNTRTVLISFVLTNILPKRFVGIELRVEDSEGHHLDDYYQEPQGKNDCYFALDSHALARFCRERLISFMPLNLAFYIDPA